MASNREWMYTMRLRGRSLIQILYDLSIISWILTSNRNTPDSEGGTARHTGGSIGFDEHRVRLRKLLGREPDWIDVFLQTHLTAASKAKYFAGDGDGLQFCNETARKAYDSFERHLLEKYGEDPTQHIINDPDLWRESQLQRQGEKTNGRIYGIGTSDLDYLVTGIYSSGASVDTRAQQEVKTLRQDLEDLQKELGEKQAQTDYENKQRELDHQQTKLKQAQLEAQVAALVKQIGHQQSGS
ncbi:hypothetical protein LXL04_006975 [Taraxacum kok-saghyz]